MAKFRFSLETLLRHREDCEERERDELMRRKYKHQIELRNLEDLKLKFQATLADLAQKQSENPAHHELTGYHLYLNRLNYEMEECQKRLMQLQSEVQAQTDVVIEASRNRKTLDSMRAKKEKEFRVAQEKQYQKDMDELIVTRYRSKDPDYPKGT